MLPFASGLGIESRPVGAQEMAAALYQGCALRRGRSGRWPKGGLSFRIKAMPITQAYLDSVVQTLNAARPVTYRKMFGGAGIYQDRVLFACVDNDRLYFKVDDQTQLKYEALGRQQFIYDPATGASMPYFELPEDVYADPGKLAEWIDESVEAARRRKAKKKKK